MNTVKTAFLLTLLSALLVVIGGAFGGRSGIIIALLIAAGMNFFAYWFSDRLVLKMYRAMPLSRDQAPQLFDILESLTARADMPMPRVYLIPADAPNAFATGRNPEHAAVAVTHGIMRLLNAEELEGVLAHELAHVRNRDVLIGSVAATLAAAVLVLARLAFFASLFGGGGGRGDRGSNPIALLATVLLAPIAAGLVQMAVSRSREYQADASGARLAGSPHGLASALQKLEEYGKRIPMPSAGPAASHLFIVRPLSRETLAGLFRTHPPVRERVRRLLGR